MSLDECNIQEFGQSIEFKSESEFEIEWQFEVKIVSLFFIIILNSVQGIREILKNRYELKRYCESTILFTRNY